ncbi:glycosyltransferase 61 family protein [Mycobacterium sp. Marseille-P9652]|uniref:glycosyltransferase 61 family protein n=1 Tax=Mycobacterium sp. Marseille-P9652 TaxID=2654950 RepID=UPI0018D1D6EF|nr:glycosyltransferase 61 family protein [Mycobacterium sp. Marseille-P9652]
MAYPNVVRDVQNAQYLSGFDHYCRHGHRTLAPHWLFSEGYYRDQNPDLTDEVLDAANLVNGYDHFLRRGAQECRRAHLFFDPKIYQAGLGPNASWLSGHAGPFHHFLDRIERGRYELRASQYFDPPWYLLRYPEVASAIERGSWRCALHHYLANDSPTIFDPSPEFSEAAYLRRYPDVAAAVDRGGFRNAYAHFIENGLAEGRLAEAASEPAAGESQTSTGKRAVAPAAFRLSGVYYIEFLTALHTHLTPRSYLEVGTATGDSLSVASCDTIAVDPQFQLKAGATGNRKRTLLFQMTSDDFFETENVPALLGRPVDLAFLDGLHRFEVLLRDFIGAEAACHPRSLILLHDCVPSNTRMALRQYHHGDPSEGDTAYWWTGDVWKLLPILREYRPDLRLHVLDCPPTGLVAISRLDPESSVLADRYYEIVDQYAGSVLDEDRLRSLWDRLELTASRPLCEEPDRLTELFTFYTPRSGMASVSNEINETQNEELLVRASSERKPDLLPRGRFLLRDWPPSDGTLTVIEAPVIVDRLRPPEFVCNLSGREIPDWFSTGAHIHGSYLVSRPDVLLFGSNHVVSKSGLWSCETRTGGFGGGTGGFKRQFMELAAHPAFSNSYPGVKPHIEFEGDEIAIDCNTLSPYDVESIAEPVFLATPLEPDNWARWIATVLPKCAQFKTFGNGRKFFCRAAYPWQRDLLQLLGIERAQVLEHDPGKTYFCRDVLTVEYSLANLSVSEAEKQIFAALANACRQDTADTFGERIFVSRLSVSAKPPYHRVLQNECDLIAALGELGFQTVEPEQLPLKEQIGMFARAKCVVALGGAGLFSTRFCPPGTTVVDIESSDTFICDHSRMLSSLGHRYGIIYGQQDPADPAQIHKRWNIDVQGACAAIREIL